VRPNRFDKAPDLPDKRIGKIKGSVKVYLSGMRARAQDFCVLLLEGKGG